MRASSTVPDSDDSRIPPPTVLARLWPVARVVILAWLGFVVILALAQRSMIYYPSRNDAEILAREAADKGFEAWQNSQGDTIGYRSLASPDDPRPPLAVLVMHGNAGYAMHRAGYAEILRTAVPDRAVSVYLLEYPGYGARPGQPAQDTLLAAADEALQNIPANIPVVLLGESIGTGVAAATASANPGRVAGLLLITPFDSLASVAQHHYPLLPVRWIMRHQYPSEEWLKNYRGPVTFILAANDTIVPAQFGQKLHDTYAGPKKLITADQADHNDLLDALPPSSWHEALRFLL